MTLLRVLPPPPPAPPPLPPPPADGLWDVMSDADVVTVAAAHLAQQAGARPSDVLAKGAADVLVQVREWGLFWGEGGHGVEF